MQSNVKKFLATHGFYLDLDLPKLTNEVLLDMNNSLSGKQAYQDMFSTYLDPSAIKIKEKSVIVIDAGGTNFRSSLVTFKNDGSSFISQFEKTKMPGTEGELSKKEFFEHIAKNIERFKDSYDEICFCFSYAMTITENLDGILTNFSKEIQAPEVVGSYIGTELKEALKAQGWSKIPQVIILNDAAAALISGTGNPKYSAYIGLILGTGLNCAYLQPAKKEFELKKQIIVCESAKFGGFKNSDFDILLDEKSLHPGTSPYEKLCSGAYLGPLALETIQVAAKEGLFSNGCADIIEKTTKLTLIEVSDFLEKSNIETGQFFPLFKDATPNQDDYKTLFAIFDSLVNRAAQLTAVLLAACLIQCEEGTSAERPVCISCNGTTFFKTYKIIERTKDYLAKILEGKNLHYEMLAAEADITIGTAKAAFRSE